MQRLPLYKPLTAKDNNMRKQGIIYLLLILGFWSCRKDFERIDPMPEIFMPELLDDFVPADQTVNSSLNGFVTDANQNPLPDVLVSLNGIITTTDLYGHFFYTDTPMNAEGSLVELELANFHKQSKRFFPTADATERMDIVMTEIEDETGLNANQGGSLTLDEGILLEYPESAFISSDGNTYTGMVTVGSTFIEANAENFALVAPGNFQAVNIENELVSLEAESLLQISYFDEEGNDLLINSDAALTVQLPNALANTEAWYYASAFGLYTLNTQTAIENNILSVELAHNAFILFGENYESELKTIQLSAQDGTGLLEDLKTELRTEDGTILQSVRTNNEGLAKVHSPTIASGTLQLEDACGNIVYNKAFSDVNDVVAVEDVSLKTLEGDLYDCDVIPVQDGVVAIEQGDQVRFHHLSNTTFSLSLQTCDGGNAGIQGLDLDSFDPNESTDISIDMLDELGDVFTCPEPRTNTLHVTNVTTGEEYFYDIQDTGGSNEVVTEFEYAGGDENINIKISFNGSQAGDYSPSNEHEIEILKDPTNNFSFSGDGESFIVTRFGNEERLTVGNFEGIFEDVDRGVVEELRGTFNFNF